MPKLDEIFATVATILWYRNDKLAVLKMFKLLLCFQQVKALKNL